MYVIRKAQGQHRNAELHLYRKLVDQTCLHENQLARVTFCGIYSVPKQMVRCLLFLSAAASGVKVMRPIHGPLTWRFMIDVAPLNDATRKLMNDATRMNDFTRKLMTDATRMKGVTPMNDVTRKLINDFTRLIDVTQMLMNDFTRLIYTARGQWPKKQKQRPKRKQGGGGGR